MAFSYYMFHKPNADDFRLFSTEHLAALAIILLLALLLVIFRKEIQQWPTATRRKLEIGAGIAVLLARGGLYLYYVLFNFDLKEVLPIYLCRVVIIALLYTLFTGRKGLLFIVYYFGIIFGVMPLIIVDTGGHTFPHATYFSFFVGHGMILLANLYYLVVDGYRPGQKDLRKALITLAVYFGIILILNPLLGGNYNYLEAAPPSIPMGAFNGTPMYKVMVTAIFLLAMVLEFLPFSKVKEEAEEVPIKLD